MCCMCHVTPWQAEQAAERAAGREAEAAASAHASEAARQVAATELQQLQERYIELEVGASAAACLLSTSRTVFVLNECIGTGAQAL